MSSIIEALFTVAPHLAEKSIPSGSYYMICCPFHGGGNEKTPSMSVSIEKPVFFCHSCSSSGHVSQLLKQYGMGKSAIDLILKSSGLDSVVTKEDRIGARYASSTKPYRGRYVLDEDVLDVYRKAPVILLNAGFKKTTLRHFECGYDKGNLRATFPLRNVYGELVGVSGRAVIEGMEPRYKIYQQELIQRKDIHVPVDYSMEETKEVLLWHAHVVRPILMNTNEFVVVTEGFKACMWIWQTVYQQVVALVGAYLTLEHAEILATSVQRVVLMLDNNPAGHKGTHYAGERLIRRGVEVLVAKYPDERQQPDNLVDHELVDAIEYAEPFTMWRDKHGEQLIHEDASKRQLRQLRRQ